MFLGCSLLPTSIVLTLSIQLNPTKAQKSQLYPTEAERYAAKLLAKAEIIVGSANKIWGMSFALVPP